jgi:hypothetical protein
LEHRDVLEIKDSTEFDSLKYEDNPFPCILFFDALKVHGKYNVATRVRKWLNSEWARLKSGDVPKVPFDTNSMAIHSPKGS